MLELLSFIMLIVRQLFYILGVLALDVYKRQAGNSIGSLRLPQRSRALHGLHIRAAHGAAA